MESTICTLFEGHYHYGLAGLVNSLHSHGFRGNVYAGYRGTLPGWASESMPSDTCHWKGASTLLVTKDIQLHFLPVHTAHHLTNYKPYFMLQLLNDLAKEAAGLFYFDPDIVIKCRWSFFEKWITYGVALVHEITSNDMPSNHPLRMQWEDVICNLDYKVHNRLTSYINGGFCGVSSKHIDFIHGWKNLFEVAINEYGLDPSRYMPSDRTDIFYATDQDLLNMAAMAYNGPISEMGPEAMDFLYGGWTMSHAVGSPKPWRKNFLISSLKGISPSLSDKEFWKNVDGPINLYNPFTGSIKRKSIAAASFISRFYSR